MNQTANVTGKGDNGVKAISSLTTAFRCECKASALTALCSSSSLSRSFFNVAGIFRVLAASLEKNPATCCGERIFLSIENWSTLFIPHSSIPFVDLPFYHTPPRWELFCQQLSLFFCKLGSTPCCWNSLSHFKWGMFVNWAFWCCVENKSGNFRLLSSYSCSVSFSGFAKQCFFF